MVFSALFLLAALALGDAGATSMSDALQTIPYSTTSVVSRRLDGTSTAVEELVATALKDNKLLEIFGNEKKVVGDTPSEFYEMADYVQHQDAFRTLYSHLEHLKKYDDAAKDHAVLLLMEKNYGMPAVSRYVSKALTANPNSAEVKRLDSALLNRWDKEKLSLHEVAEKMAPKEAEASKETLKDFPRAMLARYARLQGTSEADAEILASAALTKHFYANIDSKEKLDAVLPNLIAIQALSTSDLVRIFSVTEDARAKIFDEPNGFAFLLFVRLHKDGLDPFETFNRVRSLYKEGGDLKSFEKSRWPTTKDVGIVSKMDSFVEAVLPITFAGKIRNFYRRMWFKLIYIFKKKSNSEVVSKHESPKNKNSKPLKNNINDEAAKSPVTSSRNAVENAAVVSHPPEYTGIKVIKLELPGIKHPTKQDFHKFLKSWMDSVIASFKALKSTKNKFAAAETDLEKLKGLSDQPSSTGVVPSAIPKADDTDGAFSKLKDMLKNYEDFLDAESKQVKETAKRYYSLVSRIDVIVEADKVENAVPAVAGTNSFRTQDKIQSDKIQSDTLHKELYAEIEMAKKRKADVDDKKMKFQSDVNMAFANLRAKLPEHVNVQPNIEMSVKSTGKATDTANAGISDTTDVTLKAGNGETLLHRQRKKSSLSFDLKPLKSFWRNISPGINKKSRVSDQTSSVATAGTMPETIVRDTSSAVKNERNSFQSGPITSADTSSHMTPKNKIIGPNVIKLELPDIETSVKSTRKATDTANAGDTTDVKLKAGNGETLLYYPQSKKSFVSKRFKSFLKNISPSKIKKSRVSDRPTAGTMPETIVHDKSSAIKNERNSFQSGPSTSADTNSHMTPKNEIIDLKEENNPKISDDVQPEFKNRNPAANEDHTGHEISKGAPSDVILKINGETSSEVKPEINVETLYDDKPEIKVETLFDDKPDISVKTPSKVNTGATSPRKLRH